MPGPCIDDNVLLDYLGGQVPAEQTARIVAHLDECDACRRVTAAMAESVRQGAVTLSQDGERTELLDVPSPAPAVGEVLADRFELTEHLGQGGMGVVYAARDRRLGVPVALKLLAPRYASDPAATQLLKNEIVVARRITHANVCRVYDFGASGPHQFFTMELIRGRPLEDALDTRLPEGDAVRLFSQIAAGLAAAHAQDVVHRDLKPRNVMLDQSGAAKLMDFGLASASEGGSSPGSEDGASRVAGTPNYWAPEQARGEPAQPSADVYSAGVIGFRLLTGRQAGSARNPERRREVPRRYRKVIDRCLEEDPRRRPQNGQELHAALERARHLPQRLALTFAAALLVVGLGVVAVRTFAAQTHAARAQAALELLEAARVNEAGVELDRLVLDDVHSPQALLGAAMAKWWREQPYPLIAAACDAAIDAHQPPGRELFLRALKPLARQRWDEALGILSSAPPGAAEEPLVTYGRFEGLYHSGHPREAVRLYEDLLTARPHFRLGYDHVLDFAVATLDPPTLEFIASHSPWLSGDLAFAPYAVRLALARGEAGEALTLAERTAARSREDFGGMLLLQSLHTRLLLLKGDLAAAESELRQMPVLAPVSLVDQLGYAMAIGDGAEVQALTGPLEQELAGGAAAATEFRGRLEAFLILALHGDPQAAERIARGAISLPIPFREGSMNQPLLEALTANGEALQTLAHHHWPPVAHVARAREAEAAGRFEDAAKLWASAIDESLDERFTHLLRVLQARAWLAAGQGPMAREVCEAEATQHSLHWSAFPARAECLLLQSTSLLDEGELRSARARVELLRRTRALTRKDPLAERLHALDRRLAPH